MAGNEEWWRGCVIYQIYPRSFQDSNGDGIGDLEGIRRRLHHVADLGVDAIWLSPFFTSPMADFGYDVADYRDVDPVFGTLADFDALVDEAHRLGLKVIIDQVISHTSDRHPWFLESRRDRTNPKADWYVWVDPREDGFVPNNWLARFGGVPWQWDSRRNQYYLHNFLVEQPDLNIHNPEVRAALFDVFRFWLDRGVDGFRLDTANFYLHDPELRDNPPAGTRPQHRWEADGNPYDYQDHVYDKNRPENLAFLEELRAVADEYEGRMLLGEIGETPAKSIDLMAAYTSGKSRLHMCYSFDLLGRFFSPRFLRERIEMFETIATDGWACWTSSNHDVPRQMSRWLRDVGKEDERAKFICSVMLSLRGSACLYQGEELGLEEAELAFEDLVDPYGIQFWPASKGRDGARTPYPWSREDRHAGFSKAERTWLPVPADHAARALDTQKDRSGSIWSHYKAFIAFRRKHPALVRGAIRFLQTDEATLAFVREAPGEALLCAFNFTGKPVSIPFEEKAPVPLDQPGTAGRVGEGEILLPPLGTFFGRREAPGRG